jgi:hypothetical protein
MTGTEFVPYWLLHEPGKNHGFATVDLDSAITSERAIEVWREANAEDIRIMGLDHLEVEARLITEPFVTA